jgi:hypothetical protein
MHLATHAAPSALIRPTSFLIHAWLLNDGPSGLNVEDRISRLAAAVKFFLLSKVTVTRQFTDR